MRFKLDNLLAAINVIGIQARTAIKHVGQVWLLRNGIELVVSVSSAQSIGCIIG